MVNDESGLQAKTTQLTSYHAVSNNNEENVIITCDEEEGPCFSDYAWSCTNNLVPQTDVASWPATFNDSAAFLLRQAPTITANEGRDENWYKTLYFCNEVDSQGMNSLSSNFIYRCTASNRFASAFWQKFGALTW